MPLSKIQSDILRLLAAHRDPDSYVAGEYTTEPRRAAFFGRHRRVPDREERVLQAAEQDAAFLQELTATACDGFDEIS